MFLLYIRIQLSSGPEGGHSTHSESPLPIPGYSCVQCTVYGPFHIYTRFTPNNRGSTNNSENFPDISQDFPGFVAQPENFMAGGVQEGGPKESRNARRRVPPRGSDNRNMT